MNRCFIFGLLSGLCVTLAPGPVRAAGPAAVIYGGKIIQTGHGDADSPWEQQYEESLHLSRRELAYGDMAYGEGNASAARADYEGDETAITQYEAAIADYDKAIAYNNWSTLANPTSGGPNYNYLAYNNRGLAERALSNVQRAVGDLKGAADAFKKAETDFAQAINLNSNFSFAFNQLGEMKRDGGDLNGAKTIFHLAVNYDSKAPDALFNLANAEQRTNDFNDAAFHYGRLAELTPEDARAYFLVGVARQAMRDNDGAIASYTKSIELDPDDADYARFYLALTLRRFYRDESPAGLAAVVPDWPDGWLKTVGSYLLGELNEKDFLAEAAQGDAKLANEHLCSADYFAGLIHEFQGDSAAARDFFTKALNTKAASLNEYDLARAELARLTGKFETVN